MKRISGWMHRTRSRWWEWAFAALCYGGITALLLRCFSLQIANVLEGDLWMQVHVALEPPDHIYSFVPTYSLYKYIFRFLHWVWPGDLVFVIFVLAVALAGCLITGAYLRTFTFCKNPAVCMLLGMGIYCADPLFLPMINPYRAMGMQTAGVWHNPTLLGIKLLGVILLWLFTRITLQVEKKLPVGLLGGFAATGLIATWIKPNLILCIYPALAVILLIWLGQKGCKIFWRLAALAMTVLPSMGILLWQYLLTYGESSAQNSGIGVMFGYGIRLFNEHPAVSVVQSMAFPLAVLFVGWRSFKRADQYCLAWIATGVGYLQYLFLVETGPRMNHGNWSWGVEVMAFLLFLVSLEELLHRMGQEWDKSWHGKAWVCVCWGLLSWHVICGAMFLVQYLVQGTYFAT